MDLEQYFNCAITQEPILPALGVKIIFSQFAEIYNPPSQIKEQIFGLVEKYGFAVLSNAAVYAADNVVLTAETTQERGLLQDPFHADITTNNSARHTILKMPLREGRKAPTYYAMTADVREAVRAIDVTGQNVAVQEAVRTIGSADYSFCFDRTARQSRETVLYQYPEFTEAVFQAIPPKKKYLHEWKLGMQEVIIHSNRHGGVLHARPEKGDTCNNLCASMLD